MGRLRVFSKGLKKKENGFCAGDGDAVLDSVIRPLYNQPPQDKIRWMGGEVEVW